MKSNSTTFLFSLFAIFTLTATFSGLTLASEGVSKKVYCSQQSPKAVHGYIIEEAVLRSTNRTKWELQLAALGTGLLTEQGDGTASSGYLYTGNEPLLPNPEFRAHSAQWRNALPFVIPVKADKGEFVLYVQPESFSKTADFTVRLKVTRAAGESNFLLSCNAI
ncbi:hypothetical protein WDW37_20395 [Bdellovibrionota bacterium FG-1]